MKPAGSPARKLNVSYNCIDRHLEKRGDQYRTHLGRRRPRRIGADHLQKLHHHVCRLANVLKSRGVRKAIWVCIYMPMIPEAAYAMLACTRIGAVHSVVFGGFSRIHCATGSSTPTAIP